MYAIFYSATGGEVWEGPNGKEEVYETKQKGVSEQESVSEQEGRECIEMQEGVQLKIGKLSRDQKQESQRREIKALGGGL